MALQLILNLFIKYGLIGLLVSSFISSLFFIPGYASFLIPFYVALKFNPYLLLAVLTIGSIMGETCNYYFGLFGSKHLIKYEKEIKKATKWLNNWGEISLFVVNLIPVLPSDFISVFVGFLRMDIKIFVVSVGLGKLFQFALLIFGVQLLARFLPFGIFT